MDMDEGYFIVEKATNKIGSGPYGTFKKAVYESKFKYWYNPETWVFRYGLDDGENNFIELQEK